MDRAALAQDFADEIDALAEQVSRAIIESLRPVIEQAWRRAFSPPVTVLASVDEGALGAIVDWQPPPSALKALQTAIETGADTGMLSMGVAAGKGALPLDAAAQQWMSEASNRLVGVGSSAWQEARQVLTESLGTDLTREQVKGKLEDVLNASEYRADTIARTETQAAANAGVNISGRIMADAGVEMYKEWFTQIDGRTRPEHELADGQQVRVTDQFTVGGELLDFPGDPSGSPGNTINCRCTMLMVQSEVELPDVEPPWKADEWTGGDFELAPMTQQAVERNGVHYTFTPGDPARSDATAAVNEVYRRTGLNPGHAFRYQDAYQGGTLWENPGAWTERRAAWPVTGELDPAKLIAEDVAKLQRQQVVDWLFGQQQAATSEFERYGLAANKAPLYRADPARAALKSVAEDNFAKLAPEKLTGVYADISRGYVEGTAKDFVNISASNAKAKELQEFVKGIQQIPDDEFRRMVRALAHERIDAETYVEAMVERKNGLLKDFQTYHNRLYSQRQKFAKGGKAANEVKEEIKAFKAPAGHGGPTGFKVEVQPYSHDRALNAERAKEWDSPIFRGDPAFDEAYRYTGSGYSSINTGRRQGKRTATKLEARMGDVKKEVTVHRATNLRLDLPHEQMAGKVFHDNAFLSTSIGGTPAFSGDTVLRMKLNPGSAKGIYVDHMSAHGGEKEFIVQPGQRLYVHKVHVRGKPEPGADQNLIDVFTQRPGTKYVLDVETVTEQWARDHMGYP